MTTAERGCSRFPQMSNRTHRHDDSLGEESCTKQAKVFPKEEEKEDREPDREAVGSLFQGINELSLPAPCCQFVQPEQECFQGYISTNCGGYCVFLPVWMVLESLEFRDSPFFQIVTCGSLEFRDDPRFQLLVQDTAEEVLKFLKPGTKEETKWKSIRDSPHLAPNLHTLQFDLALLGLAIVLNREIPTQIRIWKTVGNERICVMQYGSKRDETQIRVIDVLCSIGTAGV